MVKRRSVRFFLFVFALMATLFGCGEKEKNPTRPDTLPPFEPIDAFEQVARMGRGINLGNALEAPREGDWGMVLTEAYFQLISQAGFTHVRIPISWATHCTPLPPYPVDPVFFQRVDWAIHQAFQHGLIAVINQHHHEELDQNPKDRSFGSPRSLFLAIWRQIAERYRAYPNTLLFEIKNEPHGRFTAAVWDTLWKEALAIIRETNPERNVIVGPIDWNSVYALNTLRLPRFEDEPHLIVTFHYYNPFQFTHQCASWAGDADCKWLGTTWGTEADYRAVNRDLERAAAWAASVNRPLYMGEFGAYEKADMDSRVRWTSHLARKAESLGMAWAYWEFGAGFGIYDRQNRMWRTRLLEALIPPQSP